MYKINLTNTVRASFWLKDSTLRSTKVLPQSICKLRGSGNKSKPVCVAFFSFLFSIAKCVGVFADLNIY